MVGPLTAHALLAPALLRQANTISATLTRYVTTSASNGDTSTALAEARPVVVAEVSAADKARQGLAANERMYQTTAAEAGELPEVVADWRLDLGDGVELPLSRAIPMAGVYVGLVVTLGGAP